MHSLQTVSYHSGGATQVTDHGCRDVAPISDSDLGF